MAARPQEDIDAGIYEDGRMSELARTNRANESWVQAIRTVRAARTAAGLDCDYDEDGSAVFTAEQGLVASLHTREDTAATLLLQRDILARLDHIRRLCLCIVGGVAVLVAKALL